MHVKHTGEAMQSSRQTLAFERLHSVAYHRNEDAITRLHWCRRHIKETAAINITEAGEFPAYIAALELAALLEGPPCATLQICGGPVARLQRASHLSVVAKV
jgi:hypothetical protein